MKYYVLLNKVLGLKCLRVCHPSNLSVLVPRFNAALRLLGGRNRQLPAIGAFGVEALIFQRLSVRRFVLQGIP